MSIQKEFKYMINKGVWRKPKRRNIPPSRHLIGSKWVFKNKIDGIFRARLVSRWYTQIPGLYFADNYSSVVTGVTLSIILIMWLIKKWDSQTIDVETEFLYSLLEEEI